ncbi:MAG: hypothetical protein OEQ13_11630, partial [Acidobacteriota bacterium]|nr:hypothetical protein [Acidobacteriota bacterium]
VISQLRQVFGDDAKEPRYIETIRSSGYRLIAPVRFLTETAGGRSPLEAPRPVTRPLRRRLVPVLLVASAGVIAILAGTVLLTRGRDASPGAQPLRPTPATTWPGLELDGALSPDGERLAFVWRQEGLANPDIYVKPLRGDSAVQLTDTSCPERQPVWSPDGTRVAFVRYEPGKLCKVMVVPADGGDEQELTERATLQPDLAWSPDGRFLAFSDLATPEGPAAVFLYEIATGERRQLSFPEEENHSDVNPAFSPDGREVSFERQIGRADRDVYTVSIASGEERRLTHDGTIVAGQSWDPRGRGIVMASMRSGDWRLWQVSPSAEEPVLLSVGAGKVREPSFARDVPRLVFEKRSVTTEVWELRPGGEGGRVDAEGGDPEFQKWIASTGYDHELHHSRDGTRIAFISDRSGSDQVWIAGADGSNPEQVTRMDARFVASPRWSPDDRKIAFVASPEGNTDLFVLDVATKVVRRLVDDPADDRTPSWSVDGASIYLSSNRTGQWEVFEVPAAGGEPRQLSEGGGYVPQPAPDGTSLYFLHGDRNGIWRLPLGGGEPELVVEELVTCDWGGWSVAQDAIYFFNRRQEGVKVARRDLVTGETSTVFHDPEMPSTKIPCKMRTLDVAPDESRVAVSLIGSWESDILWVDVP